MNRDDKELQIASCRLVLDILPGLETSVVFNDTVNIFFDCDYKFVDNSLYNYRMVFLRDYCHGLEVLKSLFSPMQLDY